MQKKKNNNNKVDMCDPRINPCTECQECNPADGTCTDFAEDTPCAEGGGACHDGVCDQFTGFFFYFFIFFATPPWEKNSFFLLGGGESRPKKITIQIIWIIQIIRNCFNVKKNCCCWGDQGATRRGCSVDPLVILKSSKKKKIKNKK